MHYAHQPGMTHRFSSKSITFPSNRPHVRYTSEVHGPHEGESGSGTYVCQDPSEGEPMQTNENTTGDRAASGVLTSQKVTICV